MTWKERALHAELLLQRKSTQCEGLRETLTKAGGVLRDYITASGEMDDADRALLAQIDAALSQHTEKATENEG